MTDDQCHPPKQLEPKVSKPLSSPRLSFSTPFHPLRIKENQFENKKEFVEFFQHAFRGQQTFFEAILDNTPAVIYVKNPEGKYLFTNKAFKNLFHKAPHESYMKTDYDFFPKEMADVYRKNDTKVLKTGKPLEIEEVAMHDDGLHTYISVKFPIFDENGKVTAVAGISTDISEQKSLEQDIQASRDYFEKIINAVADPIFVKDRKHHWVLLNDALCKFIGYSREELIGKSDYEFFPKEQADIFWAKDEEVFKTGRENLNEEYFTDSQGILHTIVTKKNLYTDGKGEKFIVGVIRDITEQKRAEQGLLQKTLELAQTKAEREYLELFACVASHDLQEPLQKIIAFGGLLKSCSAQSLDEKGRGFVDKLQLSAARMSRMIEDLLQFTRVTTAADLFDQVDLEMVIGEVLSDLDHKISQTRAKVEVGNLPSVYADRRQMHLLFLNLISNALKFHKSGGIPKVKIESVPAEPGYVKITVSDNGVGFDEEFAEKMFRPFERFHGRSEFDGNGIGLAICKKIVMRHGGEISARSPKKQGAVFTVLLPGTAG